MSIFAVCPFIGTILVSNTPLQRACALTVYACTKNHLFKQNYVLFLRLNVFSNEKLVCCCFRTIVVLLFNDGVVVVAMVEL